MERLRRGSLGGLQRAGPLLAAVTALAVLGLGSHAALDWHRHGSPGAGFFHLHVHFGEHDHGRDHHDGASHHRGDRRTPEPDAPGERRHAGVLTLAFGVAPAPAAAAAAVPDLLHDRNVAGRTQRLIDARLVDRPVPRGPPV